MLPREQFALIWVRAIANSRIWIALRGFSLGCPHSIIINNSGGARRPSRRFRKRKAKSIVNVHHLRRRLGARGSEQSWCFGGNGSERPTVTDGDNELL